MSSILTNTGSMVALQTLKAINKDLGSVQDQISTGKRVASSRDNSAIWAISTVMSSDVSGFKAISESLSLGSSTVSLARDASEQVTELLEEMKGSIVAAQEENVDRSKIQTDVAALRDQIVSIVDSAHSLLVDHASPGIRTVIVVDLPLRVSLFDVVDAIAAAAECAIELAGRPQDRVADDLGLDPAR